MNTPTNAKLISNCKLNVIQTIQDLDIEEIIKLHLTITLTNAFYILDQFNEKSIYGKVQEWYIHQAK